MEFLASHAAVLVGGTCSLVGAALGAWGALSRLIRQEVRAHSASREDVARLDGKIDLVLDLLAMRRSRPRKASKS